MPGPRETMLSALHVLLQPQPEPRADVPAQRCPRLARERHDAGPQGSPEILRKAPRQHAATLNALLARERGRAGGQVIDLSLLESIISVLGPDAAIYARTGVVKPRVGSASNTASPRNVCRSGDGKYLALSGSTPQVARRIFEIIGRADMNADPQFATNSDRLKHRELVDAAIGVWFAERTGAEALEQMRAAGATVGPVYSIAEVMADPHFADRGIIVEAEDPALGPVPMHNVVPRLSATPGRFRRPAPALNEHVAEVLTEAGLDPAKIRAATAG